MSAMDQESPWQDDLLPPPAGVRYLDHAATSLPKPRSVVAAVQAWFEQNGVSASRGHGRLCDEVAQAVQSCRRAAAELFGVPTERLVFLSGATEALNLAIRGMLPPPTETRPARVVTTSFEHSSVARPLTALAKERALQVEVLAPEPDGTLDPVAAAAHIAGFGPDLLVCTHASNVTGQQLPVARLAAAARAAGAGVLVDAAQSAGYLDLKSLDADAIVASGHKQLHGPPGVGLLAVRPGTEPTVHKQGGTGSSVALAEQPTDWPTAWESGTPNTPGILGLGAALAWLAKQPGGALLEHGRSLANALRSGLADIPGALVLPAHTLQEVPDGQPLPVVSLTMPAMDPAELAMVLEGIGCHVRAGHHCAPWIHRHLGTESVGTLRLSPGPASRMADIEAVLEELAGIAN